jgi:hypothetical protein
VTLLALEIIDRQIDVESRLRPENETFPILPFALRIMFRKVAPPTESGKLNFLFSIFFVR